MADFSIPLGQDAERRLPTANERTGGFPCGPADRRLFNGLFHRIESEVGEVISHAGITPTDDRFTQLREAIAAMIAAATGDGDTSQFLLLSQAQARLPIFPEFLTSDGKINVSSPATGTIRIPSGIQFMHRGIFPVTTDQTDFTTDSNKTYHIRWSLANGYELKDLSSSTYNPSTLSENDQSFDSTYDDMLISRVITNSSNVATITNLVNKDRLFFNYQSPQINMWTNTNSGSVLSGTAHVLDWARSPKTSNIALQYFENAAINSNDVSGIIRRFGFRDVDFTRYGTNDLTYYYLDGTETIGNVVYSLSGAA